MVSASLLATLLAVSGTANVTLLYFTADWCGACQSTKPVVQRLVAAGYPVREVQVDREAELVSKFRVTAVPCFVLVADGREIERVAEAASYARLVQMFGRVGASPGGPASPRGPSSVSSAGLPRPLASLARNLGQRREPEERLVQIESATPANSSPASPSNPLDPGTPPFQSPVTPSSQPPLAQSSAAESLAAGQDTHTQALRASVRLRVDDLNGHSVGTGTIIDTFNNEALIVTCGHIFRHSTGRGRIAVDVFQDRQPQTVAGTLISFDLERDLGLVAIPAPTTLTAARVAPAGYLFERGQTVFSVGCDRGADPNVRVSRITGIDRYVGAPNIEVAGQPVDGRSGGGLFSASGELIGVCNAADQSDNEGIFASLPAIHWELDRIGQRRIYSPQDKELAQQTATPERTPLPASAPATAISPEPPRPAVAIQPAAPAAGSDDTEVICIVRSRANPQGSEKLFVLDRPSRELLDRLASESRQAVASLAQQPPPRFNPPQAQPATAPQPVIRAQSR